MYLALMFAWTMQNQSLSVCQLLGRLDLYRGKTVTVRGVVMGGSHGSALFDHDRMEKTCPDLAKRGKRWPAAVSLTWPDQSVEDGFRTFEPDREAIDRNLAEVEKVLMSERRRGIYNKGIIATFSGELRARKDIRIFQKDDWFYGNGYGQAGQYPANLLIKTVTDAGLIEIEK